MRQGAPRALFRDVGRGPRRKETDDRPRVALARRRLRRAGEARAAPGWWAGRARRPGGDEGLARSPGGGTLERKARGVTAVFGWRGHRPPAASEAGCPAPGKQGHDGGSQAMMWSASSRPPTTIAMGSFSMPAGSPRQGPVRCDDWKRLVAPSGRPRDGRALRRRAPDGENENLRHRRADLEIDAGAARVVIAWVAVSGGRPSPAAGSTRSTDRGSRSTRRPHRPCSSPLPSACSGTAARSTRGRARRPR